MNSGLVLASAWQRGVLGFATAVLITLCFGPRTLPAAECDPHCDRRVHPSQYSDPRCESRRSGSHFDRVETRCDLREPRRKANQQPPSAKGPLPLAPPVARTPVIGASDPGRQLSRGVDRDVGFDDAFTTQGSAPPGGGPAGANANLGAGANPGAAGAANSNAEARRTPPGRAR